VLICILLTTVANLPHGEWSSISFLIVIAGLQHHGNIRQRAAERALGTVIGAVCGLLIIVEQAHFGISAITYVVMAAACGACAYHAIGKGGYIALLSAITLVIVAGHGDNELVDGLWRAVNVLIGIMVALVLSFALPLYATYSWRYKLSDALRGCAKVYERITSGEWVSNDAHLKEMAALSTLLVQLRSLLPSVSKEVDMPMAQLEAVQRSLRISISCLEILGSMPVAQALEDTSAVAQAAPLPVESRNIADTLYAIARALKFGSASRLTPYALPNAQPLPETMAGRMAEYVSLTLSIEIEHLRRQLAASANNWRV
jgi:uncharacterized membrane protein YccC